MTHPTDDIGENAAIGHIGPDVGDGLSPLSACSPMGIYISRGFSA